MKNQPGFAVASVLLTLCVGACASIVSGTSEPITVNASPPGAMCTLERNGEVVGQVMAPGSVTVKKSRDPITVHCNKEGYVETDQTCNSGTCGWVFGNLGFGGLIGLIIDMSNGAANDYDDTITVMLVPASQDSQLQPTVAHYPHYTSK